MPLDRAAFVRQLARIARPIEPPPLSDEQVSAIGGRGEMAIDVQGRFDSSFSLAIVNRSLALALDRLPGVQARLTAIDSAGPYLPDIGELAIPGLDELWRARDGFVPTHVIRNIYPPRVDDLDSRVQNFFYFAWEDSRIPAEWAQSFNRSLDAVIVPSEHVRELLLRSGVGIPIAVVPYGVQQEFAEIPGQPFELPTRKTFRFLHVSTGFPRKGCDVLIRAFASEFSRRDDVCLVIKTLPQYEHSVSKQVWLTRLWPRHPEILHIDRDLDPTAMRQLYRAASCLVHPARAEGFGLPVAEAMLAGIPVIATGYSGLVDFCSTETASMIGYRRERSASPFAVRHAEWAEPDQGELRQVMRRIYEAPSAPDVLRRVANAAAHVRTNFTWDRAAARTVAFAQAIDRSATRPMRAAMVTTWNERCGLAEYSRDLIGAMPPTGIRWSILAPFTDGVVRADSSAVTRCWRNQWPVDWSQVLEEVVRQDIDLVHFQAHLTMWGADEAAALTKLKEAGRLVFMTLHSVRGAQPDRALVAALSRLDRIIVHAEDDRERLAALGIEANVTTLPPGFAATGPIDRGDVRRALGLNAGPVVGTFGFLRPHKSVLELIDALSLLRRHHPDVQLLALTALYPSEESISYHERCLERIERKGLSAHCSIVTDFLETQEILCALQACDVVALPYQPVIDSVSAAVRLSLASGRPVLTTTAPMFADVADVVHQIDRATPGAIARGVADLLENDWLRLEVVAKAARRVERDSWPAIGRTYARFLRAAGTDLSAFAHAYPIRAREDESPVSASTGDPDNRDRPPGSGRL